MEKTNEEIKKNIKIMADRIGTTPRLFLAEKRKMYKELIKAARNFRGGVAALPNYDKLGKAIWDIEQCGIELRKLWKHC